MRDDRLGLTWSVRDPGGDEVECGRVVRDLTRLCRQSCGDAFPADAGYSIIMKRQSGPLDGASLTISRRGFRAQIAIQRFPRPEGESSRIEIRLVAWAEHIPVALDHRDRSASHWSIVAALAGTTGLGLAFFQVIGLLSSWGQLLALLPTLMAWRMAIAMRFANELRAQAKALMPASESQTREVHDDLRRWTEVLDRIAIERDAVAERFLGRGFRIPGAIPGSVAELTDPPVERQAPARVLPVPNLALPPLGRTTAV